MIAIIGGTGVGTFELDAPPESRTVETPYGAATVQVGRLHSREIVFLARHGGGHRIPPHRINYRANIAALVQLGVRAALATTAVGGLRADLAPGTLLLLDDLIDFTRDRSGKTFFDGQEGAPVVHADVTRPYSDLLRGHVQTAAVTAGISLDPRGTYLCGDGPRYETGAEVRLFASWGADVVGMTGVPEATLAREAGIHYAGISLVTNQGAGIADHPLTHAEVEEAMREAMPRLRALLTETILGLDPTDLPPIGPGVALPGMEVFAPAPPTASAAPVADVMRCTIDGREKYLTAAPLERDGFVYVPLREITANLGGTAVAMGSDAFTTTIGPWTAKVEAGIAEISVEGNGHYVLISLEAPPIFEYEDLLVPSSFFRDVFGYEVEVVDNTLSIVNPAAP